jgi:GntR family transcriptional regulator/MocR family aminotransferase
MRYRETLTVPLTVDRAAPVRLADQIAGQLTVAIDTGVLTGGTRMPSTRTLAVLLGVSRGVASAAYDVLFERGYVAGRGGSGTYVARPARRPAAPAPAVEKADVDLTPGRPSAELFPLAAWRAAWRHASCQLPGLEDTPPLGLPELRRAVADHLRQTRGLVLPGHEVVVTRGVVPGLRLVLAALAPDRAGPRTVTVPADAPPHWREAVLAAGGRPVRVGGTVEIAADSLFQPRSRGTATVLVGGFCGLLTPTLQLGYAVVPRSMAGALERAVTLGGDQPAYPGQLALARLLADGTLVRLMHRLGRARQDKRATVAAALAGLPVAVDDPTPGTVLLRLPDAAATAESLARRGIRVAVAPDGSGVLVGFGHLPDPALRRALSALAAALSATMRPLGRLDGIWRGLPQHSHNSEGIHLHQAVDACA